MRVSFWKYFGKVLISIISLLLGGWISSWCFSGMNVNDSIIVMGSTVLAVITFGLTLFVICEIIWYDELRRIKKSIQSAMNGF